MRHYRAVVQACPRLLYVNRHLLIRPYGIALFSVFIGQFPFHFESFFSCINRIVLIVFIRQQALAVPVNNTRKKRPSRVSRALHMFPKSFFRRFRSTPNIYTRFIKILFRVCFSCSFCQGEFLVKFYYINTVFSRYHIRSSTF